MARVHTVTQGESISSIAKEYGFFPSTLWNHPENASIKAQRVNGECLLAGDRVFVPDVRAKEETLATGNVHRFRRKGVPAPFELRLLFGVTPRAQEEFVLTHEAGEVTGKTDGDGWLRIHLPPEARHGRLALAGGREVYDLDFGHLDPWDTVSGAQARLRNLGYLRGDPTGEIDPATSEAVAAFRRQHDLGGSTDLDAATLDAIRDAHGN